MLLIDAGNSTLKWAVVDAGQWRAQGRSDYADGAGLMQELTVDTDCFIASVADAACEQWLGALMHGAGISPLWLKTEAGFGDLKNRYLNPQQLGVDRWMGLIGARQRTCDPVLVVSAGTAMTVDALTADGVFLGGVIVPGFALMRQALQQGTAQVVEVAGEMQAFPRVTADAVHSGILAALCGAIRQQYAQLAEAAGKPPRCLLTGGDAAILLPHLNLNLPVESIPALILEGIHCVAAESMSR
jgi:type III pantothenate kinase